MTSTFKPDRPEHVVEAVAWALAGEVPLDVIAGGTKRGLGRPSNAGHTLDLSGLTGVSLYEADELVLSAAAGTKLSEIEKLLGEQRQQLAFEPPDFGPLLGGKAGEQTMGGVIACNLAGPRRVKAGAARDHFLGFSAVSGRGEEFKSGGRVVKNVTGYDLCKLMAGSFGTLGVMTTLTVKVLPAPEKTRTVLVYGLDAAHAVAALTEALQSSHEVSGAAHLPDKVAARSAVAYVKDAGAAVTAARVEGPGPSVEYRCAALREALGARGKTEELHGTNSDVFWREVRDLAPFVEAQSRHIWKLSVPPAEAAAVAAGITGTLDAEVVYDWGGGLIWLAIEARGDAVGTGTSGAAEAAIRAAVAPTGGHATLFRAPADVRAATAVFQPQAPGVAALSKRLKENFDPKGILNPGRMYAGV